MSNILETLYILVKLETEEVKKGLDEAQIAVKKLEDRFESVGKYSNKAGESFRDTVRSVLHLAAGFASFHAILSSASGAVASIRDVGQASRELNVDVTALDAWGHAVQRTGGTAQQFQSTLASLSQHFGTTNEIALRALPRLADAFSKLNPRQAQNYGKSLGIDQATILLLQQGRREVEDTIKQQQRLGLVTQQQVEVTRKFDNALYDAGRAYQEFYRQLLIPLLPGITEGLNYFIAHKEAVQDSFRAMAVGVGVLTLALIRLGGPVTKAAAGIAAISAAYGLVKEDIKFFREGKDSAIGNALGFVPGALKSSTQLGTNIASQSLGGYLLNLPSQVASSVGGAFGYKTEVRIENVNINTAATDAQGIANAARGSLQEQLSQLNSQIDNGVHA